MEPERHISSLGELAYARCACVLSPRKMAHPMNGYQGRERSISATERFQRNRHKHFDLRCLLSEWQRFHDEQNPRGKMRLNLHTPTHRHDDYRNPRCACAPRVNDYSFDNNDITPETTYPTYVSCFYTCDVKYSTLTVAKKDLKDYVDFRHELWMEKRWCFSCSE